jgi:hypothetical protein
VLIATVFSLAGCATSAGGYISGQTLDADTKQPIPDVAVMIWWEGQSSMIVDSQSVCVAADSTVTDAEGKFRFSPWIKPTSPLIGGVHYGVLAYKQGYEIGRVGYEDRHIYMEQFEGSLEDRFSDLTILSNAARCNADNENLLPFVKSLYREANDTAVSKKEKMLVLGLLKRIEDKELGEEEAEKRLEIRWKQLHER